MSSSWRSGKELEVRPGARGPGDGGQEAEGSEAGGLGAGTSGLMAGGGFRGAFPSTPSTKNLSTGHIVLSSYHLGGPG